MPLTYILSLDTPTAPDALRAELAARHGLVVSDWLTMDGTPWLTGERGSVLVEAGDPESGRPWDHPQPVTVEVTLYPSRHADTWAYLLRLAGDILQRCPGDAALEPDTGGTTLLRRGATVWLDPDPFDREHLLSGSFRPATLIEGLPPVPAWSPATARPSMERLYLDTPASADAVRAWLAEAFGFRPRDDRRTAGGVPWLSSGRGWVLVIPPDGFDRGPRTHPQPTTLVVHLDTRNKPGVFAHLLRVAGDLLQHCPGDAVMQSEETGMATLVRRGGTVWLDPDPFYREHLRAGSFRPAELVEVPPPPAPAGARRGGTAA